MYVVYMPVVSVVGALAKKLWMPLHVFNTAEEMPALEYVMIDYAIKESLFKKMYGSISHDKESEKELSHANVLHIKVA